MYGFEAEIRIRRLIAGVLICALIIGWIIAWYFLFESLELDEPDKASHITIYSDNGEVIREYENVQFDEIGFPQEKLIVYQAKDGTKRTSYTNAKWEIEQGE